MALEVFDLTHLAYFFTANFQRASEDIQQSPWNLLWQGDWEESKPSPECATRISSWRRRVRDVSRGRVWPAERPAHHGLCSSKGSSKKFRWAHAGSHVHFGKLSGGTRDGTGLNTDWCHGCYCVLKEKAFSLVGATDSSRLRMLPRIWHDERCRTSGFFDRSFGSVVFDRLRNSSRSPNFAGTRMISFSLPEEITVSDARWDGLHGFVRVCSEAQDVAGPQMLVRAPCAFFGAKPLSTTSLSLKKTWLMRGTPFPAGPALGPQTCFAFSQHRFGRLSVGSLIHPKPLGFWISSLPARTEEKRGTLLVLKGTIAGWREQLQ